MKLLGKMVATAVAFASLAAPAAALACDEDYYRQPANYDNGQYYDPAYNNQVYVPQPQVYVPQPQVRVVVPTPRIVFRPLWGEARWERRWHGRHGRRW